MANVNPSSNNPINPVIEREPREPPRGGKVTAAWLWGLMVAIVLAAVLFGTFYGDNYSPPGRPGEVEGQPPPGAPAPGTR